MPLLRRLTVCLHWWLNLPFRFVRFNNVTSTFTTAMLSYLLTIRLLNVFSLLTVEPTGFYVGGHRPQHTVLTPSAFLHGSSESTTFNTSQPLSFRRPQETENRYVDQFFHCPTSQSSTVNYRHLSYDILPIHITPKDSNSDNYHNVHTEKIRDDLDHEASSQGEPQPQRQYFNPAILQLPFANQQSVSSLTSPQYLIVSRMVTQGLHQESHMCLARMSSSTTKASTRSGEDKKSNEELYCIEEPIRVNIPPTPALKCEGAWSSFPEIPGFHDPRVFWSGKGEPLIMINSASQYGCIGLWVVDLRTLHPKLDSLLSRPTRSSNQKPEAHMSAVTQTENGDSHAWFRRNNDNDNDGSARGPVEADEGDTLPVPGETTAKYIPMSYPRLTEITRRDRSPVEKNWLMFFPTRDTAYVQYDLGSKERSLAKLVGHGYTSEEQTHPALNVSLHDSLGQEGQWHQGSNSLRLVLCPREALRRPGSDCLPRQSDPGSTSDSTSTSTSTSASDADPNGAADDDDETPTRQCPEEKLIARGRVVHFAILHRKFTNDLKLPMRYERYMVVWEARPPFAVLGVSRRPLLMRGEGAQPWRDSPRTYFTYSPSMTWGFRAGGGGRAPGPGPGPGPAKESECGDSEGDLGTGFLGDEVLIGIGMDDKDQGFVKVRVNDLLECLRKV